MWKRLKLLMKGLLFLVIALSSLPILTILTSYFLNPYARVQILEQESLFYVTDKPSPLPWSLMNVDNVVEESSTATLVRNSKVRKQMDKLYWTSVHGSNEAEAYHFISAYLDDRTDARGRPAVVVVGYFSRTAVPTDLYCLLKFSSGRTGCLRQKATQGKANCDSVVDIKKSKPMLYVCHLPSGLSSELPLSVKMSNVSNCDPSYTSGEIPVGNLENVRKKYPIKKKFGVFIGGPLIHKENVLQNITRFIQMSQLLGAEFFTIYISPEQTNKSVIEFLFDTYPDIVRVIEWKKFEIHYPLHYYGQLVLIADCLYRSMHEVEYLVMMDLDEMILPIKHNNWAELVKYLEKKGKYASFMFLNRFFATSPQYTTSNNNATSLNNSLEQSLNESSPSLDPKIVQYFKGDDIPMYFTRTQEVECYYGYGAKTKLIMNPRRMVRGTVHQSCESVRSYKPTYHVPPEVGISAHYRESSIPDCISKPSVENMVAIKFAKIFAERFRNKT